MRAAPGLSFGHDDRACAVLDCLEGRWTYLTGDEKNVWLAAVSGHVECIPDTHRPILRDFRERGMLWDADPEPPRVPHTQRPVLVPPVDPSRIRRKVRAAWKTVYRWQDSGLYRQILLVHAAHSRGLPYADPPLAQAIVREVCAPVWGVRARALTPMTVAFVAVTSADALGVRLDWEVGMQHEGEMPVAWVSTPQVVIGRREGWIPVETF